MNLYHPVPFCVSTHTALGKKNRSKLSLLNINYKWHSAFLTNDKRQTDENEKSYLLKYVRHIQYLLSLAKKSNVDQVHSRRFQLEVVCYHCI